MPLPLWGVCSCFDAEYASAAFVTFPSQMACALLSNGGSNGELLFTFQLYKRGPNRNHPITCCSCFVGVVSWWLPSSCSAVFFGTWYWCISQMASGRCCFYVVAPAVWFLLRICQFRCLGLHLLRQGNVIHACLLVRVFFLSARRCV